MGGPNTVQHSRSQCEKHPKYGSGAMLIQGKNVGSKSTVDESMLCYGGPRNECVARLFVRAMKMRCVWEPTWSIDVEKRVGESDDKSVMNRQRQGT